MLLPELTNYVVENGYPGFRAKQLYDWMHVKLVRNVEEMKNIPKNMQEWLTDQLVSVEVVERFESKIDGTNKFVFRLQDGNVIESVFMPYKHGNSVCISSQAGCRMGCRFCASTLMGLARNLTASEMLDQIYAITRIMEQRVSNVVVMGTGEPLDNYDNLCRFIRMLTDENGLHISQRNITVSSCGLVPKIYDLADEGFAITFALSLHASTDEKRRELMPIANTYSIADLLKGMSCHVNLIPVNPIKERSFKRADENSIQKFKQMLEKNTINVTIRRGMGKDIDAACGQLRKTYIESE